MKMRIPTYKRFLLMVYVLGSFSVALGQQQNDSLVQYLAIAAGNNPTVLQKFNEYQASLQKVPQVGSLPNPELSVGVFLSPMELLAGKQVADIRLMQMFPWFGVLKNAKDEMSLMAKSNYEQFRESKLQVYLDVQRTWFELQKVHQNIVITEKNRDILGAVERLTLNRFKASSATGNSASSASSYSVGNNQQNNTSNSSGMNAMGVPGGGTAARSGQQPSAMQGSSMATSAGGTGLADVYRVQIEKAELENTIAQLKNQQRTMVARFNSYLNRPPSTPVAVPDSLRADTLNTSLLTLPDSMLTRSPMLGMLRYEQQSLDARKTMVRRMSYPMVGVGVNYSVINKSAMSTSEMNGKDMIMPMVTITLPIYRGKYKSQQTEIDFQKTATVLRYQSTTNALQNEYYEALQQYEDAEHRIQLYEKQSQLVKKTLDIVVKTFSASGTGLTDVLGIGRQMLDYELKKVEATTDYNTAIAWMKRLGCVETP